MRTRTIRRAAGVPLAALGLALATTAPASAAQLSGGSTTLRLDSGTAKALSGAGVSVTPVKPARAGRAGVAFPITGGKADPATLAGTINHSGGLRLRAGRSSVRLTSFRVKVGKRSSLSALLGGKRVTILSLSTTRAKVRRNGFDTTVSGVKASLNATAASALNQAFDTRLFKRGLTLGTVTVAAKFAQTDLATRGATTLALDPGTAAALTSLGVTPSPIAPATAGSGGLSFPIAGRTSLDLKTLAGHISHTGGIALTKGSTRVALTDFLIRIDSKPILAAKLGGGKLTAIADLDLKGIKKTVRGRTITVSGVKVALNAAAAGALNNAFGTTAITPGTPLGTATVVATGK